MSKIRINDLARELEVKSKEILDVLTTVGVTEKKTHSSSLEDHEAELVRKHLRGRSEGAPSSAKTSRAAHGDEGIKTKIDLSNISRPGDVLRAITQQKGVAERPAARPAVTPPVEKPALDARAGTPKAMPPKPATDAPASPAPRMVTPASVAAGYRPPTVVVIPPKVPVAPPAATTPAATSTTAASPAIAVPPRATSPAAQAPAHNNVAQRQDAAPAKSGAPIASPPRMIMPQTGPRPVYKAPLAAPGAPSPSAASRPMPGRPVPGQPIFQRTARPQAPGTARPPLRPGERRPMHPTRVAPAGSRPLGVGPGAGAMAPPGLTRPGSRPGGPSRRPGQRDVPRGVKEGPMKGYPPPPRMTISNEPAPITRNITITEGISVKDLAEKLGVRAKDVIARLVVRGVFATINQTLDAELASEMARFFGADTEVISFEEQAAKDTTEATESKEEGAEAIPRPPVVTIMGHVDHGKTTLLDSIRSTNVAGGEAGGITQHIGAYKVAITDKASPAYGREIVFLDTPGHEAFTRMRARGAKVTDIVVLVVAADDGVMPQTKEAIDHAKAAKVPIIVAINKIDKPEAQLDRVRRQLADVGLMSADWGGDTEFVEVSAKQKKGIDKLLETILLVADLRELKANPDAPATGTVLESRVDKGRGPVATILVQNGTLNSGDFFICGSVFGQGRAMFDDRGRPVKDAPPSTPVEVLGLQGVPDAGDLFQVTDEAKARHIVEYRQGKQRDAADAPTSGSRITLDQLHEQLKAGDVKELGIVIKGDVQGSVEVLSEMLPKLSTDQGKLKIIGSGVGAVTENDVLLASASGAIVIAFGVRPDRKALELAQQEHVEIRPHTIIYEVSDEIKKAMEGLLEPVF